MFVYESVLLGLVLLLKGDVMMGCLLMLVVMIGVVVVFIVMIVLELILLYIWNVFVSVLIGFYCF